MIVRPKSALYLSFPYNFNTKQEAIEAKRKFKQTLHQSNEQEITKRTSTTIISGARTSTRSYKDYGPSLFHEIKKTYSQSQALIKDQRCSKQKKLKPCKKISIRSIENSTYRFNQVKRSIKAVCDETKFINDILKNSTPLKSNYHSSGYKPLLAKRALSKRTQNMEVKGHKQRRFFSIFNENGIEKSQNKQNIN